METTARLKLDVNAITRGDSCRVTIAVVIFNEGRSSFDVGNLRIRGWHSTAPRAAPGSPAYFDVDKMEHGDQVLDANPPPDLFLNRHFPPGSQFDQTFTWEFKKLDGLYIFRTDAYDRQDILLKNAREWAEWSCGQ